MTDLRIGQAVILDQNRIKQLLSIWNHVQFELLSIATVVMDAALLTPLSLGIFVWARYWPPGQVFAWIACLILLSFNITRLLAALEIPPDKIRSLTAGVMFIILFLMIRTLVHSPDSMLDFSWIIEFFRDLTQASSFRWAQDVGIFILVIFAWTRGQSLLNRAADINRVGLKLRVGGLLLAPLIVWLGHARLVWDVSPYLLLFLLAGLTAVALTRAEEMEKSRSGYSASLKPQWISVIFIAALLTVLTAALTAIIISGESAVSVLGWLAPLVITIQFMFSIALSTLIYLLIPLWRTMDLVVNGIVNIILSGQTFLQSSLRLLIKLLSKLMTPSTEIEFVQPGGSDTAVSEPIVRRFIDLTLFGQYANLMGFLLIIALVLVIALFVSAQYQKTKFDENEAQPKHQKRRRRRASNLVTQLLSKLGILKNWRTAVSIRRIYRHMGLAAEANGYPRLVTETPYEYIQTLLQAWPEHEAEIRLITAAYINVRYGEIPEQKDQLDAIIQAWQILEETQPVKSTN